jgi:hypothetical protein
MIVLFHGSNLLLQNRMTSTFPIHEKELVGWIICQQKAAGNEYTVSYILIQINTVRKINTVSNNMKNQTP